MVASWAVFPALLAGVMHLSTPATAVSPPPDAGFHIQFTGALDVPGSVRIVEVDGDVPQALIARLQARNKYVVCYMSAGSTEDWRADAAQIPAAAVGKPLKGWPGEWWLDIRNEGVMQVMHARIARLAAKGCDGIEFDNVDGYSNATGFPLRATDQVTFNLALADSARASGMSPGLKNAVELIPDLVAGFDWALNEECVTYNECHRYRPFVAAGKPVYVLEYGETPRAKVCRVTARYGLEGQLKRLRLDAWSYRCPQTG